MNQRLPIEEIAKLARIHLEPEEMERFGRQLEQILVFFDQLAAIDTEGIEPTTHVLDISNVMRDDRPEASLPREEVLSNLPSQFEGMPRVPPVLEE